MKVVNKTRHKNEASHESPAFNIGKIIFSHFTKLRKNPKAYHLKNRTSARILFSHFLINFNAVGFLRASFRPALIKTR